MPTIASARRRQSAITDHFRAVTSHRTTPRHKSSRRATITPGSMPSYQTALPGMQLLQQYPPSLARPMISASLQDTSARPTMQPSSHSVGSQHMQPPSASASYSNHHGGGYSVPQLLSSNRGYSASQPPASQQKSSNRDYSASQPPASQQHPRLREYCTHPGGGYSASASQPPALQLIDSHHHVGDYSTQPINSRSRRSIVITKVVTTYPRIRLPRSRSIVTTKVMTTRPRSRSPRSRPPCSCLPVRPDCRAIRHLVVITMVGVLGYAAACTADPSQGTSVLWS
jgi:hypothetical protein